MNGNSHISWQRPGRSCPDDDKTVLGYYSLTILDRELNIDRRRGFFIVFYFSFGQGSFTIPTPIDRFQSLVDIAFFGHFSEHFNLDSFKFGFQSQIGIIPVTTNPQPLKLFSLQIHIFQGIIPAVTPKLNYICTVTIDTHVLDSLLLDGETMSIPSRYIRAVITIHGPKLNDHVFQNLI